MRKHSSFEIHSDEIESRKSRDSTGYHSGSRRYWVGFVAVVILSFATVCGGAALPTITTQPQSLTANIRSTVNFTVVASGSAPLVYQWRKSTNNLVDGGNFSGTRTTNLTLTDITLGNAAQPSSAGQYSVVVTDAGGSVTSSTATLTVNSLPTISPISDQLTVANAAVGPIAFTVEDLESAAIRLTLSKTSSNPTLVPTANIVFGGSGTDRTVTVTPATNEVGSSTVSITVSDENGGATTTAFVFTVNDHGLCDLTSKGKDFWLTFPGNYAPDPDNTNRLTLSIVGPPNTKGSVTVPGLGFTSNFVIPSSMTVNVSLPRETDLGNLIDGIVNKGIHVTASTDVSVFGVNQVRYTTDSYLALHTAILGREYIVLGYGNVHATAPSLNGTQFAIVACQSNTTVTITPSVTTGTRASGVPYNLTLHTGETYQLRNTNAAPSDLTGTLISADKPVAVFGGHQAANIPSGNLFFSDHLVEQLLPTSQWGTTFYTVPLATRLSSDTFRFLASEDATMVSVNGVTVATLNRGQFHQMALSAAAKITADKPICVAHYANSSDFDGVVNADPFMSLVQATRHYLTNYMFCTITDAFPTNYLNIVVPAGAVGTMQLDGINLPGASFSLIGSSGYSAAQLRVSVGSHTLTGGQPFGASVYGWAEYESYGHPLGFFIGAATPIGTCKSDVAANPLVIQCPSNIVVQSTSYQGVEVAFNVSYTGGCDSNAVIRCTPLSGALFPIGMTVVSCVVSNPCGATVSCSFTVIVLPPIKPTITVQPKNQTVVVGSNVTLGVSATGLPTPAYQWVRSGENLPNATGANLILNNVTANQSGLYTVLVTNIGGSVTSVPAMLTVVSSLFQAPKPHTTAAIRDSGFSLELMVEVGRPFRVQASMNLLTWSDLTNFTSTGAAFQFLDAAATNQTRRFYRVILP